VGGSDMMTGKERVTEIVSRKGLYSCMNNTKWKELQSAVGKLSFPPPYIIKDVCEEEPNISDFDKDVDYWGDWSDEGLYDWGNYFAIEWIKVRPRYTKYQGRLMPCVIAEDITEEFLAILKKYNIPYEADGDAFIIYGYRK
jgi:hypothetical protein